MTNHFLTQGAYRGWHRIWKLKLHSIVWHASVEAWTCLTGTVMPRTNNKLPTTNSSVGYKALRSCLTVHMALSRRIPIVTKSNQYTGAPFLPSVHIPIQHSSKRVVSVLLWKTSFGTRDWSTFCDTCFVRRSAAFAELAIFCRVKRPSAIHCCKARSRTCTCFMRPRPWRVAVPMAAVLSQRSRTVVGRPMSVRSSRRPNASAAPTLIA